MSATSSPRRDSAERARSSLWVWPALAAGLALVSALLLTRIRPEEGSGPSQLWHGDVGSATALLQVLATSVMTATTLTFSLTVLALQLASQQFSPRLLREFGRDPVTKQVLSVLAGTFVFTTATLYGIRSDEAVPSASMVVALTLGIASLGAILGFITHIVKVIRVDTMMLVVHDETHHAITAFYPRHDEQGSRLPSEDELESDDGAVLTAARSGFVQRTHVQQLVELARAYDSVVRVEVRAGDHVVRGTPLATVWGTGGAPCEQVDDALAGGIRKAVVLGYERTMDQDAGFGFRQLEDIAVKAMSPSMNDPVTAAHAVGHMGDLLVELTGCRLGPTLHDDDAGVGRAIVPDRDLRYYLDLACGQLRRFAAGEPSVLIALLRMLRDVAVACRDDDQRDEVRRATTLVASTLADTVADVDAQAVDDMSSRVERALAGDVLAAYADRIGETRSI
ncbi:MAG: DUF2254 domain-containing protein [Ilumatobacteraceae bacterium]